MPSTTRRRHRLARLAAASVVLLAPLLVLAQPASALPCVEVTVDYPYIYAKVCPPI